MKLIRLATDNNGYFKSSFGNDLVIKPQSKMALLNLTFEAKEIDLIQITSKNNQVTFKSDSTEIETFGTHLLKNTSYKGSETDVKKFYDDLIHALNGAITNADQTNSMSSMFYSSTGDGNQNLNYRYSPFLNPLNFDGEGASFFNSGAGGDNAVITAVTTSDKTTISKKPGLPATDDRSNAMFTGLGVFGRGNGLLMIRLNTCITNSSGLEDNGFGIGLTKTDLTKTIEVGQDIPSSARDIEIRFNRLSENYVFINKQDNALEVNSGVAPLNVLGTPQDDKDVLFFRRFNNRITGGVIQLIGGTAPANAVVSTFFTHEVDSTSNYFPYVYFRGTSIHCEVDMFNYSIDPRINQRFLTEESAWTMADWDVTDLDYEGNPGNGFANGLAQAAGASIFNGTSANEFPLPSLISQPWNQTKTASLFLHVDVWEALGFGRNIQPDAEGYALRNFDIGVDAGVGNRICWSSLRPQFPTTVSLVDNFMVESMTLNLDSFDASEPYYSLLPTQPNLNIEADKLGRRKNILMTIPVNQTASGLVQYESSTPIFIDINNDFPINLKNLNFRILDKNFKEISQGGDAAIMTILLD